MYPFLMPFSYTVLDLQEEGKLSYNKLVSTHRISVFCAIGGILPPSLSLVRNTVSNEVGSSLSAST